MQEMEEEEITMMDINNMGSKLIDPIEKNATLIGVGAVLLPKVNAIQEEIGLILRGNVHAPNIQSVLTDVANNPNFRSAVLAIIGGNLVQDAGYPILAKIGRAGIKIATAYLATGIAENIVFHSTHSDMPPGFIPNPKGKTGISENPFNGRYA
jgi:hypothetical protein